MGKNFHGWLQNENSQIKFSQMPARVTDRTAKTPNSRMLGQPQNPQKFCPAKIPTIQYVNMDVTTVHQLLYVHTVNTRLSTAICFQRIWWINEFGGLTGCSLVLVHYIGTGKLWWVKRFGG